jgi:hypothetical protein
MLFFPRIPGEGLLSPRAGDEIGWEIGFCGFSDIYTVAKLCQVSTPHDDCRRFY